MHASRWPLSHFVSMTVTTGAGKIETVRLVAGSPFIPVVAETAPMEPSAQANNHSAKTGAA